MERGFEGRRWNIVPFDAPEGGSPLILLLAGFEALTDELREAFEAAEVLPLWLAMPLDIDWDRDYTPWPAAGTGGRVFAGGAGELMKSAAALCVALRGELGAGSVWAVGYSLGGLAAMWLHSCLSFDGAGSCSGSLWYPGFTDWLAAHPPGGRIYLSLGEKEKNTKNPQMAVNPEATERAALICKSSAGGVIFRAEPGGHFKDPEGRIARAAGWLCGGIKNSPPANSRAGK